MAADGRGLPCDLAEAVRWMKLAAQHDFLDAKERLGKLERARHSGPLAAGEKALADATKLGPQALYDVARRAVRPEGRGVAAARVQALPARRAPRPPRSADAGRLPLPARPRHRAESRSLARLVRALRPPGRRVRAGRSRRALRDRRAREEGPRAGVQVHTQGRRGRRRGRSLPARAHVRGRPRHRTEPGPGPVLDGEAARFKIADSAERLVALRAAAATATVRAVIAPPDPSAAKKKAWKPW